MNQKPLKRLIKQQKGLISAVLKTTLQQIIDVSDEQILSHLEVEERGD